MREIAYRLSHKIRIENLSQLGWAGQAMKDSDADFMGQPVGREGKTGINLEWLAPIRMQMYFASWLLII